MSADLVRISEPRLNYTSTGKFSSYTVECFHDGLKDHRVFKSSDAGILQNKVQTLLYQWEEKWERHQQAAAKVASATAAEAATVRAQAALTECDQLLAKSLIVDDRVDWNSLRRRTPFVWTGTRLQGIRYNSPANEPVAIVKLKAPAKPEITQPKYQPRLDLLDYLIPPLKRKKLEAAAALFKGDIAAYEESLAQRDRVHQDREKVLAEQRSMFNAARDAYELEGQTANARIDQLQQLWLSKDVDAVVEHSELVLNSSAYPDWLTPDFEIAYLPDTGMLVIDYQLPSPEQLPSVERVTYVKSRNEVTEKHLTEAKAKKLFDSVCYQVALRTIHELFEADVPDALRAITFNGWVEAIDRATGRNTRSCILSVQALKEEFLAIDLAHVDPKACFKLLKGVAAASLAQLAPVRPMLRLDRNDARFVDSYDVAHRLDETTNLAAMSWEDFEHLVRELFGKVFSGAGAEVRVTQASRDGGVDAIALDPDPIKGGKIVIQAKRYTGTVGVSAVRDLYGTVLNEGANRGILVTTSDFGPDAYKFATGKPITLLSGGNLLSLLAEHGHKAKIDLTEARRLTKP